MRPRFDRSCGRIGAFVLVLALVLAGRRKIEDEDEDENENGNGNGNEKDDPVQLRLFSSFHGGRR